MSSNSLYSDLSLVKKLKRDDKKAFEIIFNRYKLKLYFFALKCIRSKSEAEEIVQNTFVSLWEHRHMLNELLSIKSYLYKSVVNHVYNYMKHEAIHQKYLSYTLSNQQETENSDNDVLYNDLKKNIDNLIELLPSQQQIIFKMSRVEGLSHPEIAEKLGISVRSVENQVYRALKYLKKNLHIIENPSIIVLLSIIMLY